MNEDGSLSDDASSLLKISAEAKVDNAGALRSSGDATITGKTAIENSGRVYTKGNTDLSSTENINNSGSIYTVGNTRFKVQNTIDNSGSVYADGNITTDSQGNIENHGSIYAQGNTQLLTQKNITNTGTIAALGNTELNANGLASKISNSLDGVIAAGMKNDGTLSTQSLSTLKVSAVKEIDNAGQMRSTAHTKIDSKTAINNTGNISAKLNAELDTERDIHNSGSLYAGEKISIKTLVDINNKGTINSDGDVELISQADIDNQGSVYGKGNATLTAFKNIENNGTIAALKNTTLTPTGEQSKITSTKDSILAAGVHADGRFNETGTLDIIATTSIAAHGKNLSGGNQKMHAQKIDLSGSKEHGHNIELTATQGDVDTSGADISTPGTLSITANGNATQTLFNKKGKLNAGHLNLNLANLDNTQGNLIQSGTGDTLIKLNNQQNSEKGTLDNTEGYIGTNGQKIIIDSASIKNHKGSIQHAGTELAQMTSTGKFYNAQGHLISNGQIQVEAESVANQDGKIHSNKALTNPDELASSLSITSTNNIDDKHGSIQARGNSRIQTTIFENTDGKVRGENNLQLQTNTLTGKGILSAGNDLDLSLQGDYTYENDKHITADNQLSIRTTGKFTNEAKLQSLKKLNLSADIIEQKGELIAGEKITTNSRLLTNTGQIIGGQLSLIASEKIINQDPKALIGATDTNGVLEMLAPIIHNRDDITATDTSPQTQILGLGKVVLAGGKDSNGQYTRANHILNQSARIESGKKLDAFAETLTNTRGILTATSTFEIIEPPKNAAADVAKKETIRGRKSKNRIKKNPIYTVVYTDANPDVPGGRYIEPPHGGEWNSDYINTTYQIIGTSRNRIDQITPQAQIIAGGDFTPQVTTLQNYWSKVTAQGNIDLNNVTLDQDSWRGAQRLAEITSYKGYYNYRTYRGRHWQHTWGPENLTSKLITTYESTLTSQKEILGQGNTIINGAVPSGITGSYSDPTVSQPRAFSNNHGIQSAAVGSSFITGRSNLQSVVV